MTERAFFWKGKPLDALTMGEALEALQWVCAELEQYYDESFRRAQALGRVEMLRRGESMH